MKPPRQKTIDAKYCNYKSANPQTRPVKDHTKLVYSFSGLPRSRPDRNDTNLINTLPGPSRLRLAKNETGSTNQGQGHLSRSSSDGDSDVPLVKRRRTALKQPTMGRNAVIAPIRSGSDNDFLKKFNIEDDGYLMTGTAEVPQAARKLTPGVSERMGSFASSTHVEPTPKRLLAMAFLEIAQKRLLTYAGPETRELEKRCYQWQESGKPHDKFCLICWSANTDLACHTCKRVYHVSCLKPAMTVEAAHGSCHCPLCIKRTWFEEAPSRDLDPERRMMTLASQLQSIVPMAAWMNKKNTGEALDDQKLLYDMDVIAVGSTENALGEVVPQAIPEADMSDVSTDVKEEHIKEEQFEVETSDKQPSERPLANNDELEMITCVCGEHNFRGEYLECEQNMIGCDGCLGWEHYECMDYDLPQYFCERCRPQDHERLLAAISRGEKPWEQLNRHVPEPLEEARVNYDADTGLPTLPPDEPSQEIPPVALEVEKASVPEIPAQNKRRKPRKSTGRPKKERSEARKTKRNSLRYTGDGMLSGPDAMTALRKADWAATRDLYLYNKGWTRAPERPETSASQETPMALSFADRAVALTFAS